MANIKSAKKRINTILRQKTENRLVKSALSTNIKKFKKLLTASDFEAAEKQLKEVVSMLDAACSKGVLHKNNAARKKSRLTIAYNKAKNEKKVETPKKPEKAEEVKAEIASNESAEVKAEEKVAEKPVAKKAPAAKSATTTKTVTTAKTAEKEKPAPKTTKTVAKK